MSIMRELLNDPFYELIKKYDRCVIDYCLIEDDAPYQGYRSHKDILQFAMFKMIERYDEPIPLNMDIGKALAHQIDPEELLHVPEILRTDHIGQRFYDCDIPDPLKGDGEHRIPLYLQGLQREGRYRPGQGSSRPHQVCLQCFPEKLKSALRT